MGHAPPGGGGASQSATHVTLAVRGWGYGTSVACAHLHVARGDAGTRLLVVSGCLIHWMHRSTCCLARCPCRPLRDLSAAICTSSRRCIAATHTRTRARACACARPSPLALGPSRDAIKVQYNVIACHSM